MKQPQSAGRKPAHSVDVYQLVTDRISEALEQGTIPWRKTWQHYGLARNYITGHVYTGINALLTNLSPYEEPFFITLKQANALGGQVKRGAKSLPIVYWKISYKDQDGTIVSADDAHQRGDLTKLFFARYYRVFNIADIDGITFEVPMANEHNRIKACEDLVTKIKQPPTLRLGGDQPSYAPPIDTVRMPGINQFESAEAYYATLFHELIHSTGHSSRLNREEVMSMVKFGSLVYSQEELTAEIGASFLCQITGISNPEVFTNTTAYIQGWLSKLNDDKRFIFQAASKAKKAVKYILH
ncbi:MAG: zincin-like metallopeptidase domain-containing protein [Bacteroidota bacterium]